MSWKKAEADFALQAWLIALPQKQHPSFRPQGARAKARKLAPLLVYLASNIQNYINTAEPKLESKTTCLLKTFGVFIVSQRRGHRLWLAVDSAGEAFVVGAASSTDFPTLNASGLWPRQFRGDDVFVTAFNTNGSALLYSVYLGGAKNDFGYGLALDPVGMPTSWTDAFIEFRRTTRCTPRSTGPATPSSPKSCWPPLRRD